MASTAIVVCTWRGSRGEILEEVEAALTLGRRVGGALGADLHWLVVGPALASAGEIAARHGVAALETIEDPKLEGGQPDAFVEALVQYCATRSPRLLLFNQTFDTRLAAPRLAGRLSCGVVMNGVDVEAQAEGPLRVIAAAYGGDTRVAYEVSPATPCIVALIANAVLPEPADEAAEPPTVTAIEVDLAGVAERIRVVEPARREGPRLEDAEIIVAGGRGLQSPENFKLVEQLAEALGGMAGASRPLVDDGWVDASAQVGLTGKITRPALYIAAGISGASQHMAGCAAAKTLVAINSDPDAAIFRYARYGIVGDCLEVLPEVIRAAREAK
jgi:electron transfer flavoprotein alpha subunit